MDVKTAKDLPTGSQVTYRGELWTATEGQPRQWVATAADHNIDAWLANGGQIVFLPAGRGHWHAKEERDREALRTDEARERLARWLWIDRGHDPEAWDRREAAIATVKRHEPGLEVQYARTFEDVLARADEILSVITGTEN